MGVKRDKWNAEFRHGEPLRWQCPACRESPLRVVAGSLSDGETRDSKAMHGELAFEPDLHVDGRFACLMDCAHCGNHVGVAGTYRMKDERYEDADHGEAGDYVKCYSPRFFTESPHLVQMPEATPATVVDEMVGAFQLFWADPLGCANRIRSAVEKLLTAERVPQTARDKNGKRFFLTLHSRIERYRKEQKDIGDKLMAMKWIGNAGSHSKGAVRDDALDGFELMDWVLDTLYARRHHRALELTRVINRRRAPRSPRRRSPGK
jgi:hypothetical protein